MAKNEASLFTVEEYKKSFKSAKEEQIQMAVCEYLRNNYPNVIWFCDVASGLKLPIWIATKHSKMRSSRGLPDLFIAHTKPMKYEDDSYGGLFIELKKDGIRLKNGSMPKTEHIREQEAILDRLRLLGYKCEFGVGYDECVKLIDDYLK